MTGRSVYDPAGQVASDETVSVIWIIDSEQWPRAFLRAELIERGYDAVGYVNIEDALRSIGSRFPDVIVVDLRDVTREDIAQLFQIGVPVIGIAGRSEQDWLKEFKWGALLQRPISIGEIADRVASAL
jgi:DNA-binding response OmpR family regulator